MSAHRHYDVFGLLVSFRVLPDEVQDKFTLIEALVPPGLGAPPNAHPGESECFRVLDGQFEFMIDSQVHRATAGDTLVVPEGAAHAFTCIGDRPGRLAIVNAPGRVHVEFFRGIGRPMPDDSRLPEPPAGPPDLARIMAVAQAAGMTLLPPEGGAR